MKTREEVEAFIKEQFEDNENVKKKYRKPAGKWHASPQAHHYGKCELKDLVAFIFEAKE